MKVIIFLTGICGELEKKSSFDFFYPKKWNYTHIKAIGKPKHINVKP